MISMRKWTILALLIAVASLLLSACITITPASESSGMNTGEDAGENTGENIEDSAREEAVMLKTGMYYQQDPEIGGLNTPYIYIDPERQTFSTARGPAYSFALFGYYQTEGSIYTLKTEEQDPKTIVLRTLSEEEIQVVSLEGFDPEKYEIWKHEGDIFALKGSNGICGGIAGDNYDSVKISNCYNTGNIQSSNRPGGIIGLSYNGLVTIEKCYSIGNIETTTPYSWTSGTDYPSVTNCYYLNTEDYSDTKIVGFAAGTALMLQEMKSVDAFAGFDFDSVWTMAGNPEYPYPELQVFCKPLDGDINGDSILDTSDARLALKNIVGLIDFTAEQAQIADMNEDGKMNSVDIRRMLLTITANAS